MSINEAVYGDINQRTAAWAAHEMLKHAKPVQVATQFAQVRPIPNNKAETVKFRRPVPYDAATTPLQEGVTPAARKPSYVDVQATLQQYGDLVGITDFVNDVAEDPVLAQQSMLCGEQAGLTTEMLLFGKLKAGTNVFYANGASRSAVNTAVSKAKLRAVTRYLRNQKADMVTKMLAPSQNIGTVPIEAAYICIAPVDLENDIRELDGFRETAAYGSRKTVSDYELGSVENIRFLVTPELEPWADAGGAKGSMVSTTGTSADVYPMLIFGQDAFAVTPLKGKEAIHPTVCNPNKVSKSDPLGQRGYVGWKTYWAGLITNQSWIARLEVAATDL